MKAESLTAGLLEPLTEIYRYGNPSSVDEQNVWIGSTAICPQHFYLAHIEGVKIQVVEKLFGRRPAQISNRGHWQFLLEPISLLLKLRGHYVKGFVPKRVAPRTADAVRGSGPVILVDGSKSVKHMTEIIGEGKPVY
jgi:hypothetical protein